MVGQRKELQRRVMQNKNALTKRGEDKGKRDRPSSPSPGPRSPCKDIQDGKGAAKGKSRKAPARLVNRSSASQDVELREQAVGLNERETVHPEKKSGKRSPRATRTHENYGKIHQNPGTIGIISGCYPGWSSTSSQPQRTHVKLQGRDPNNTVWAEDGARKAVLAMEQKAVQKSRNAPEKQGYILQTNDGMESSIDLDRQSRRKRLISLLILVLPCM